MEKINKTKRWFFEKIKLINFTHTHQEKKNERAQINKIRNEKRSFKPNNRTIRDYYKEQYYNKMENLEEICKYLGR